MHVYNLPIHCFKVYYCQEQPVIPFCHRLDCSPYTHLIQRIQANMRDLREDKFVPTDELRRLTQVSSPPSWGHAASNRFINLLLRGDSLPQPTLTQSSPSSSPSTRSGPSEYSASTPSLSDSESIDESQTNRDVERVGSGQPPPSFPVIEGPPRPRELVRPIPNL
jgi:hypothetical protein